MRLSGILLLCFVGAWMWWRPNIDANYVRAALAFFALALLAIGTAWGGRRRT